MYKIYVLLLILLAAVCVSAAPVTKCVGDGCRKPKALVDNQELSSWNIKFGRMSFGKSAAVSSMTEGSPGILATLFGKTLDDTKIATSSNFQFGDLGIRKTLMSNIVYHDQH